MEYYNEMGGPVSLETVRQKVESYLIALGINPGGQDTMYNFMKLMGEINRDRGQLCMILILLCRNRAAAVII